MKKRLIIIFTLLLMMATLTGVLAGCSSKNNAVLKNSVDTYGFSAITAVEMLAVEMGSRSGLLAKQSNGQGNFDGEENEGMQKSGLIAEKMGGNKNQNNSTPSEENLEVISKYLAIFEDMLNGNAPIESSLSASDKEGYAHKMSITTRDISGKASEYVFYYNETEIAEQPEPDDEFEKDQEKETKLSGILMVGGDEYKLEGKKELDGEEMEIEFRAILDNKMVIVKQEIEQDEQEFVYTYLEDGKVISKSLVEMEVDARESEIRLSTVAGTATNSYFFKKKLKGNGSEFIKIHARENGSNTVITVKTIINANGNEEYQYSFNNGNVLSKEKCQKLSKK